MLLGISLPLQLTRIVLLTLCFALLSLLLAGCDSSARGSHDEEIALESDAERTLRLYNQSCIACHGSGAAEAPLSFNANAWAEHLEKGIDTLIEHTRNGYNSMPPRGLCIDCDDADFRALILYMATPH